MAHAVAVTPAESAAAIVACRVVHAVGPSAGFAVALGVELLSLLKPETVCDTTFLVPRARRSVTDAASAKIAIVDFFMASLPLPNIQIQTVLCGDQEPNPACRD